VVPSDAGFYIGGDLGGVLNGAPGTSDFLDTGDLPPFGLSSNPQHNSFSKSGFFGGVQAGYNWQFNQWGVLGVEVDWDWGNTKYSFCRQTDVASLPCSDNGVGFKTIGSGIKSLATARARVGVLAVP
jgi:outer membrane immunogenic protein